MMVIYCRSSIFSAFVTHLATAPKKKTACFLLSWSVFPGVEGQLQMAEQIKRFCVSQMPGLTEMEMERLRPKSSKVPVECSVISEISTQHIYSKTGRFQKTNGTLEMMKL